MRAHWVKLACTGARARVRHHDGRAQSESRTDPVNAPPASSVAHGIAEPVAQARISLARKRVYKRLERAVDFPVVIVTAPAGFGKSTVMREFLALHGRAHKRINLAPKHGDLLDFMRVLATSLSDIAPALLTSVVGVYDRLNGAADAPQQIAQWAVGHLGSAGVCVLVDGLENATDERLFPLLREFVDQTSRTNVRWILVAPNVTALPLARWLADDRMDLPIDEVDLELTFEDFLATAEHSEASISGAQMRALCSSAANWPAAVALLLSEPAPLRAEISESAQRRPYEYFATRAFSARVGLEQQFLLETCLFTSFDIELLAAAGWLNADSLLRNLCDAGAFLFLDAGGSYRYHSLFGKFLEDRLRSSSNDLYARVAGAVADVCRRVGRWSDALDLYTGLQAATPLASLLSDHGFELMDRGESAIVHRALAPLSDIEFEEFPVALALKATLESLYGSFDVAEAWFRHAIETAGNSRQRGEIVFRFATDLVRRDRRSAIDILQPIVQEGEHELGLAVSLGGLLATAYATHHMDVEAAATIEQALRQMVDVDDTSIRAKVYFQAGYVALFARDFVRAKSFAQRALDTALTSHLYDIAARALSILYNVAMDFEDDIEATRLYLDELASCSIKAGSRHLLMYATLGQYEIEVLSGNLAQSARLDAALKSLEVDYSVIATETLLPAQALRATWTGDFHRAYRLIAPTAEKQITPVRQAQRYAEIAVYAAAAGLRSEAFAAATRALATAPKSRPADNAVTFTKAYVALALTLLGRRGRALQILRTLRRSGRLTPRLDQLIRAIRTINERWTRGRYPTPLRAVLDRLDAVNFGGIGRLIEALPLPETVRGEFALLTATEREVLMHLSAGSEPSEIAALSNRSPKAVDASIVSLCRKLGCSSPRHAVALLQTSQARPTADVHGA